MILAATSLHMHVHTQVEAFHQIPIQYSLSQLATCCNSQVQSHIQSLVNHKDFICSVVEPTNVLEYSLIKHHLTCAIIKHQYIYNNTLYHIDTKHVQGGARGL